MGTQAAARWLWTDSGAPAQLARASLVPAAAAYAACARVRAGAYRRGLLRSCHAGVPTIAVGNLTVGGTGKTPMASWVASFCATLGVRPAIVLRGYGGDEGQVHRERLPGAIVAEGRNRPRAARHAVRLGARAIVLDDAYQRLDLLRDLNLLLMSDEVWPRNRWTIPAGPWREPWSAARRADAVILTRKGNGSQAAAHVGDRLVGLGMPAGRIAMVRLDLASLTTLDTGQPVSLSMLRGARVLAVSGVADPVGFSRQLKQLGARVTAAACGDHHRYTKADVARLSNAAGAADYVVMTHKDAVKLRPLWSRAEPQPLVAHLEPIWEQGRDLVASLITDLLTRHYTLGMY